MYCDGNCKHLDDQKHKCLLTGEKLTWLRQTGTISYTVHEHRGFCENDNVEPPEGGDGDGH